MYLCFVSVAVTGLDDIFLSGSALAHTKDITLPGLILFPLGFPHLCWSSVQDISVGISFIPHCR